MKTCPTCQRGYADETLTFCLVDGSILSAPHDPQETQRIPAPRTTAPAPTQVLDTPSLHPTIASPHQPLYSDRPRLPSQESRSSRTGLTLGLGVLLGIILALGIAVGFMWLGKNNAVDDDSRIPNTNQSPTATPTISSRSSIDLPGGRWQECETHVQEICGLWIRGTDGQWRGRWGGLEANLTITVNGKNVTVTRRDATSSLEATYRGTLNAEETQITGTVDWCCDDLGNRSGTWRAHSQGAEMK
jgi:hypothetical protein